MALKERAVFFALLSYLSGDEAILIILVYTGSFPLSFSQMLPLSLSFCFLDTAMMRTIGPGFCLASIGKFYQKFRISSAV